MHPDQPPQGPIPPQIEGALIAHRKLLELLISMLAAERGDTTALIDDLERRLFYQDGEEDPGAEPDQAFAAQTEAGNELRRLLRSVRAALASTP